MILRLRGSAVFLSLFVAVLIGLPDSAFAASASIPSGIPDISQAQTAFGNFAANLKSFSWVVLLVGIVIGGVAWALFGQQKIAIGVLIGAVIIGGGSYIIGIIARGWT